MAKRKIAKVAKKATKKAVRKKLRKDAAENLPSAVSTRRAASAAMPETWRIGNGTNGVPTVVYIHGIANKPPVRMLKEQWDRALFGDDMGDLTRMAYWADLLYPFPLATESESVMSLALGDVPAAGAPGSLDWQKDLPPELKEYADKLLANWEERLAEIADSESGPIGSHVLPAPKWLRRWLTEQFTKTFLKDSAAYFYDKDKRNAIQGRLRNMLVPGGGPYVLISHSQGTIIAYEVLHQLAAQGNHVKVPLWITLGSPLGYTEVQDQLQPDTFKAPPNVERWLNVADPLDPVSLDTDLADEYTGPIQDAQVVNPDRRLADVTSPHSVTGYLRTPPVRDAVKRLVRPILGSGFRDFVMARDVAAEIGALQERMHVLIELEGALETTMLIEKRGSLVDELKSLIPAAELPQARIEPLRRFLGAHLSAREINMLSSRHKDLRISRIWKNYQKRALLNISGDVVQARTAHISYGARGQEVHWAVLDSGINSGHPHFAKHQNVVAQWDCTQPGPPLPDGRQDLLPGGNDEYGHGTHVAGIIAGEGQSNGHTLYGIAPQCKLHSYKVLADDGTGYDSWIIRALDHIAELNESSSRLVIQGVNLSLGGPFDVTVFGCGYSPICKELRRLWRQGVVVCVAAGNEGRLTVATPDGESAVNQDISIGDPANLEECLAVGSVHKEFPHSHGVSYFSSRGPTADGRVKPDLVAPGEKISSCNSMHDIPGAPAYVELSGTSMACPHVSGVVAAFLSKRREFVGRPDRVKEILLGNCTDIGRDRYHQGAGIVNLARMLASI